MISYFFEVFNWGWGDTAYWIFVTGGLYFLYQGKDKLAATMILLALIALVTLSSLL